MNFNINGLPQRDPKPRNNGLTMVMDKGLSLRETEDFLSVGGEFTDMVKLGFGTAYITPKLGEKLKIYRDHAMPYYFGGTLFEAFLVRNQFDDYRKLLDQFDVKLVEVSDGSINISHDQKCKYIEELSKQVTVISEVGSKDIDKIIPPYKWIEQMKAEIQAGSWKVIAEARESGNVGIFRGNGEVRSGLVEEILTQIPKETIIWEAPQKSQQVWFIKLLGANVNLGNIAPNEILPLETLRLGLRGDSFDFFLP
jgi:phosphosulfolactate synthase